MTRQYLIHVANPFGKFEPQIIHGDKPTEKTLNGIRRFREKPILIHPKLHNLGLDIIAQIYEVRK